MVGSLGAEAISAASIANQVMMVFSLAIFGGLSGASIFDRVVVLSSSRRMAAKPCSRLTRRTTASSRSSEVVFTLTSSFPAESRVSPSLTTLISLRIRLFGNEK